MIIVTIKYSVTDRDAVLAIAKPYSAAARLANGNHEHFIMPTYEDNQLYSVEVWDSMSDYEAFRATEAARTFTACREPYFLEETRKMQFYEVLKTDAA